MGFLRSTANRRHAGVLLYLNANKYFCFTQGTKLKETVTHLLIPQAADQVECLWLFYFSLATNHLAHHSTCSFSWVLETFSLNGTWWRSGSKFESNALCQLGSHLLPINSKRVGEYEKHSSMCVSRPLLTRSKGNTWHLYQTHLEPNE